ncbi:hypothetical protein WME79_30295 [Sorangium sp. So ce726]|uniref:hypothetical protein n=1 Tax=Sorangium sp. So ce726 TaxID=3133319 RepID=UPI003F5FAE4D
MNSIVNSHQGMFMACLFLLIPLLGAAGCAGQEEWDSDELVAVAAQAHRVQSGEQLFERATFGGNGRRCATCHSEETGTISPADVQARYAANPHDPLFRPIDSDDGVGDSYTRLLNEATIRFEFPLPPNIWIQDDPAATSVTVFRGVPSVKNSPALDPLITFDAREPDLETQAANAILAHFEPTVTPTQRQLEKIADYERTLFSSRELRRYAHGGPEPELPRGHTRSEKRGRKHFLPNGVCGQCHSGPMLNTSSEQFPFGAFTRITGVLTGFSGEVLGTSEVRPTPNPMHRYAMACPSDGSGLLCSNPDLFFPLIAVYQPRLENGVLSMLAADPGSALVLGTLDVLGDGKTTSLWGINETAPYFHDNSAPTLEDVIHHYKLAFEAAPILAAPILGGRSTLTAQEEADMVAYLKLL